MGNLLLTLQSVANTMRVFERAFEVVQNNVANASTPGYAKQVLGLKALPFELGSGLVGGVAAGDLISYRSGYAEQAVRQQQQSLGRYSQRVSDLEKIETVFPVVEGSGIPAALSSFFQAASALTVTPNDASARQTVIDRAADLARSFNTTASSLMSADVAARQQAGDVVSHINSLAGTIRDINAQIRQNHDLVNDSGLDTQRQTALEDLSELASFTTLQQSDGTTTVLLGGQTPLVLGDQVHSISLDSTGAAPRILSESNRDITSTITQGKLWSVLDLIIRQIPSYRGDLDQLAAALVNNINTTLDGGWDASGNPPAQELFDPDGATAATMTANALDTSELAVALPNQPGGNGNALNLANLASAGIVSGYSASQAYGALAGRVGYDLAEARSNQSVQEQLVAQARSFRGQISDVSLDEEAARLMEFQRSYQAAAKLFSVLDDLTNTVINLIR